MCVCADGVCAYPSKHACLAFGHVPDALFLRTICCHNGMAQRPVMALLGVHTVRRGRREHRFSIEAEKDWYCSYEALAPVLSRRAAPVAKAILPG